MAENGYKQEIWSLSELYPSLDSDEVKAAQDEVETRVSAFEEVRERLSPAMDSEAFVGILDQYDELVRLVSRLMAYGELKFTEDTQNQEAQAFQARMQQMAAEADNRTMFFKLWWKALEDEETTDLMAASGDFAYWLEELRHQKPHTLTEPEEKIINLKDVNGPHAMVTLWDSITNRYVYPLEINGEKKELTQGELMVYVKDPDPDLRQGAYQSLYSVFEPDVPILGQIYQARIRDHVSEQVKLRNYAAPISARNLSNDLPDEVVDMLLEVCEANAPIFQRYFKLKARWIGMDKLRRFDIYAPVTKTDKTFPFEESVELTLESFRKFEPKVADLARMVFDEHHIDSEVRKGKRTGAFCLTVEPALTPWVMQNYQGKPDDVATMAHELGHAIHSLLANGHTALTQSSSLPLAETASTFSEMLLIDELLERDPDPEVQRDLLFRQMDDSFATIQRQAFFAMFEKTAFDVVDQGASIDDLSAAYWENLESQFGDSLVLNEEFRIEWAVVPHFVHYPFYVYAYAFGQLLVLSLYKQYQEEGESFKPRYIELLSAGGSDSPERILTRAGIDMRSEAFWNGGFEVVENSLKKLEALEIPETA